MSLVVPAVLPSSKADLTEKLNLFAAIPKISRVQIDVVDGKFAAPASWPYTAPEELERMVKEGATLPHLESITYEIDLMCADTVSAAGAWIALGATRLTLHAESATDLSGLLATLRQRYGGGTARVPGLLTLGLALNVASSPALIEPYVQEVEYIQYMGIARIGQQGQPLDERVYEKIRSFRTRHPETPLQVDGGITLDKAKKLVALGAASLVIGSGILKASDPIATVAAFEELETPFGV